MKKQTWKSPAQIFAEDLKQRNIETLTAQIEKLAKSRTFELDELFEVFQKILNQRGSFSVREFDTECKKVVLLTGGFLIEETNYMQEIALKEFCKENDIKLLDCFSA